MTFLAVRMLLVQLLEADVLRVLPEALSAQVEVVLSDETVPVGARAAETITFTREFLDERQFELR